MVRMHVSIVAQMRHGCRVMWRADDNAIAIVAAGAVDPLVALLVSPAVGVQEAAAGVLQNLAVNGARARVRRRATEAPWSCNMERRREYDYNRGCGRRGTADGAARVAGRWRAGGSCAGPVEPRCEWCACVCPSSRNEVTVFVSCGAQPTI